MKISTRLIYSSVCASGLLLTASPGASAIEVNCEAGGLKAAVEAAGIDASAETSLTVVGSLDASDFDFIREMTALKSLDLSGATTSPAGQLPAYALLSSGVTDFSFPEGITEIGSGALGNSHITTLVIPSTVTKIDAGAFSNMEELTEVTIPASVTSLPTMLFKDCQKLQKATIDANVASLPAEFFRNCPALTAVSLPSSLTSISDYAFSGCSALTSLPLPETLRSIGDYAFASCTALEELHAPASLTSIGAWCFAGCDNLVEVRFDAPIASYGQGAFYNATALQTSLADISGDATELPDYLLYNVAGADGVGFDNTQVEKIGVKALSGNQSELISLPSTLSYIGDNAMEDWTSLTKIEALKCLEIPALGTSVWEGVDQGSVILYVPNGSIEEYRDAPQWQDFDIRELTASQIGITAADSEQANLRAAFDGMLLRLEADLDIRAAQLYDISGRCLTIANNFQSNRLTVDTTPYSATVFIVRVLLSDGTTPVLKLAR